LVISNQLLVVKDTSKLEVKTLGDWVIENGGLAYQGTWAL
jgi:hypothetical protein